MKKFFKNLGLWTLIILLTLTALAAVRSPSLVGAEWIGMGSALGDVLEALFRVFISIGTLAWGLLQILLSS